MTVEGYSFVAWEEHIVNSERGKRLVNFYLKSSRGDSLLSVIGTERSMRHMTYVLSEDFVQAYGSDFACAKWRARRGVVEWLDSVVSNTQKMGVPEGLLVSGLCAGRSCPPDQLVQRKLKAHSSIIEWSGTAWICAKQLKHYPAFCFNASTIHVHSFVFIAAEDEDRYLGYLEDMYADKKGQKRVKVRWFYRHQEISGIIPLNNPHPREVFITRNVQVISAECVDGLSTILTPKHYEQSLDVVQDVSESGIFMCYRQLEEFNLKPFALTKLRGYTNQPLVSSLNGCLVSKPLIKRHTSDEEDDEEHALVDSIGTDAKKFKSCVEGLMIGSGFQSQVTNFGQCPPKPIPRLLRKTVDSESTEQWSHSQFSYEVDGLVEFLCQDSGIRGCWYRCKILKVSKKCVKLQYRDLLDADDSDLLEEWVPAYKIADPDKLGMRYSGRMTIRPDPPISSENDNIDVGAAVNAWWHDGWWEGVVTQSDSGKGSFQVYLPGEDLLKSFQRKNLRTSKEWINNRWVDIEPKTDIVSYLSAKRHPKMIFSSGLNRATTSGSGGPATGEYKSDNSCKIEIAEEVSGAEASFPVSSCDDYETNTLKHETLTEAGGSEKGEEAEH